MTSNPYIAGRPIRSNEQKLFFGREKLFQSIQDNLLQGTQVILLYGQRRIGKTSVLFQIPNFVRLEKKFVFLHFDLQGKACQSLGCVLWELANTINNSSALQSKVALPQREELEKDTGIFLSNFLPQVYKVINDKNLVLVLDEFDVLSDNIKDAAGEHFFNYLESIIHQQKKLYIIPVVGRQLEEIPTLLQLFKEAIKLEIGLLDEDSARRLITQPVLLDEDSARRLITQPVEGTLVYEDDAIRAILELSSGHPFFTQLLCHVVFERARNKGYPPVMRTDVEAVVAQALVRGEAGLLWFRDGLPTLERVIFSAAAEAQERGVPGGLWKLLEEYGILQKKPLREAVDRLVKWGFLRHLSEAESPTYKVAVELVRRWMVKQYPLRRELESCLELRASTLEDLAKQAKALKERESNNVQQWLPIFGEERSEILNRLMSPLRDISESELQLVSIATKVLALYSKETHKEQLPEECLVTISLMAYLESLKAILLLLDNQTLWTQIGKVPIYQLALEQIEQSEQWQLDDEDEGKETNSILFYFHESDLAKEFNHTLLSQLQQAGLSKPEASNLTDRVALNTHRYIILALNETTDLANYLIEASRNRRWKELKKYENIENYLDYQLNKYKTIEQYLEEIAKKPLEHVFHEKEISFNDIYVHLQDCEEILLQDWAEEILKNPDKQDRVMFVQGGPGRGKSVFCRMFADWVRQTLHPILTPVFIKLRDINTLEQSFEKTLQHILNWDFVKNNENWLMDRNTRFLFLLDGFDELVIERQTGQGLKDFLWNIDSFQRRCERNSEEMGHRVLITGRTLASPVTEQGMLPSLERFKIHPMNPKLQKQWIKKWGVQVGSDKSSAFQQFLQSPNCPKEVNDLAKEPLLLYLLAAMYRDDKITFEMFKGTSGGEAKIRLYEASLNWVLIHQRPAWLEQALKELNREDQQDLKRILAEAGLCVLQSGGKSASMAMLEQRLQNNKLAIWLIQKAREQKADNTFNTTLTSFYLQPSSERRGSVEFTHKSFSEFLCAKRFKESLEDWTQIGRHQEFYIPTDRLEWEIYDLFGFGGLTPEIVSHLMALLKASEDFPLVELFNRLESFYLRWCKGEFIDAPPENLPQRKMRQLQKPLEEQGLSLGQRQIDVYVGLNILILLLELHRYAQSQDNLKSEIAFYPCGKPNTECDVEQQDEDVQQDDLVPQCSISRPQTSWKPSILDDETFDPSRLLRLVGYSHCINVGAFVKTVGPFLKGANLRRADLSEADLRGADLSNAYLASANLSGANLCGAKLCEAFLVNVKLRDANLRGADLSNAVLSDADLRGGVFTDAVFINAVLSGAELRGTHFSSADLTGAYLGDANLTNAKLAGTNLTSAFLIGANLAGANLTGVILGGANLTGANLAGANLENLSWNRDTKWEGIQGLNKAINMSDKLKKELKQYFKTELDQLMEATSC